MNTSPTFVPFSQPLAGVPAGGVSTGRLADDRPAAPASDPGRALDEAVVHFCAVATSNEAEGRYHRFSAALHGLLAAIDRAAPALTAEGIAGRVKTARRLLAASPLAWRLQNWPRGYPGDFETIEMMCRADSAGLLQGTTRCVEEWALNCPPVQQHRNKIRRQAALMMETLLGASAAAPAKVLSIACGPSRDVRLIAPLAPVCHGEIWLNDADADALEFSASKLDAVPIRCHFHHGNIFRVYKALSADGPFDLVLAGGLFDYLNDRQASHLIRRVDELLLAPGGRFFFTNIIAGHGYRGCMEHLVTWQLIERSSEEVLKLCDAAGVTADRVDMTTDETGLALLVTVQRDR
jgi:extracellular factor (EF) 3-hydroxypalmitic acid methyl ester biosynthesis protein